MKKNNTLYLILSILIQVTLVILIFYQNKKNIQYKIENKELQLELNSIVYEYEVSRINQLHSLVLNGIDLNGLNIGDVKLKNHSINDIIDKNTMLVLFLSELNCESCYEKEFSNITAQAFVPKEKIIIIGAFQNKRTFLAFIQKYKDLNISLYYVDINKKQIDPLLKVESPIYFLIDRSYKTNLVFIPNRYKTNKTEVYLKVASNHFSQLN
jgi:hypothetical protein